MKRQTPDLEWRDNRVPVSSRFDDPYYSLENGLEETRHVFLAGNGLPERFEDGFHVAELGFGTGLNLVAALQSWRASGQAGALRYTSFEAYPMTPEDMRKALASFPGIKELVSELTPYLGKPEFELPDLQFQLILGDARHALPSWHGRANAWFLDGFSPAKNPQLWQEDLLAEVGRASAPGATAATYTAAGSVRRALQSAGFDVMRVPGYGRKRHMTIARKPAEPLP